ncbi:Formyltetrahydrofolate deformylase [compost metagenome]
MQILLSCFFIKCYIQMIIIIQCKDQVGLVADISRILSAARLNIISMREHVDKAENRFFMRLEVDGQSDEVLLEAQMRHVLPMGAIIQVNPVPDKKIVVMVT